MPQSKKDLVDVFIDYENVRKIARNQFCSFTAEPHEGMVDPLALAELICAKRNRPSTLRRVRVYRGRPVPQKQPKPAQYFDLHAADWRRNSQLELISRPLKYFRPDPSGQPNFELATEKGIDVSLAIDLVETVTGDNPPDVAIVFSNDTDLLPAVELSYRRGTHTEVACWEGSHGLRFEQGKNMPMWCHIMEKADFFTTCTDDLYSI